MALWQKAGTVWSDMWHNFPKAQPQHAPPLRLHRRELSWSKTQTVTAKHEHNTNAQKARHFFPFSDWRLILAWTRAEPVGAVAPVLHPSLSSSFLFIFFSFPRLWDDAAARRLVAEAGDGSRLAARQSAVKVDVAQVFWRPLRQTHLVVVVDHPPAERHGIHIFYGARKCHRSRGSISQRQRKGHHRKQARKSKKVLKVQCGNILRKPAWLCRSYLKHHQNLLRKPIYGII